MEVMNGDTRSCLRVVDRSLGTRTSEVFEAVKSIYHGLLPAEVIPLEDYDGVPTVGFNRDCKATIIFSIDEAAYVPFTHGMYRPRVAHARNIVEASGREFGFLHTVEALFAHELGHAVLLSHLHREFGDNAFDIHAEQTRRELWSLPLAMPSSDALNCWSNNTGGYRSTLEKYNYTTETFRAKIDENLHAYGQLDSEHIADMTSDIIMQQLYPPTSPSHG